MVLVTIITPMYAVIVCYILVEDDELMLKNMYDYERGKKGFGAK